MLSEVPVTGGDVCVRIIEEPGSGSFLVFGFARTKRQWVLVAAEAGLFFFWDYCAEHVETYPD